MASTEEIDLNGLRAKDLKNMITELGGELPSGTLEKSDLVSLVEKLKLSRGSGHKFFIKQLQIGQDIANPEKTENPMEQLLWNFAKQMLNFVYIIGDETTKEVFLIDPAWDPLGLVKYCTDRGFTVAGAILTHYHVDHAGGIPPPPFNSFGITVGGAKEILQNGIPVYCHEADLDKLCDQINVNKSKIHTVQDGHELQIGEFTIKCIHAPGHTRGSMVLACEQENFVITGDVVFPGSCGKLEEDWPDACQMMHGSLMNLGDTLQDCMVIYPGHRYGPPQSTIGKEKQLGFLKPCTFPQFQAKFAAPSTAQN